MLARHPPRQATRCLPVCHCFSSDKLLHKHRYLLQQFVVGRFSARAATPPPYDALEWAKKPLAERVRMACASCASCASWALQGYGTPVAVYAAYVLKLAAYIGMWMFFCAYTPGLGDPATIAEWWLHPIAFQKAIGWSVLFEVLGLACSAGTSATATCTTSGCSPPCRPSAASRRASCAALRCIFVESQPLHRQSMQWRICDAATGELERGEVSVAELREIQPWSFERAGQKKSAS